jgi:HPt (histidine-containing phosphotransfer) domain-containing protein
MIKKQADNALPIVKAEVLERIGGDESFLQELLTLYFEEFAEKTKILDTEIQKKNFAAIQELGHNLKGASANLSLPALQAAAYDMEFAGREKKIEKAQAALAALKKEFKILKEYLG